jgi:hypothetical protein
MPEVEAEKDSGQRKSSAIIRARVSEKRNPTPSWVRGVGERQLPRLL